MGRLLEEMKVKIFVTVLVMLIVIMGANGRLINVGGKFGWINQGINYTIWASQENFYVGDWLFFRFEKYQFDVLEVNQTNYETCNNENFIANITKGGRDVYELKEARPYYFICSKGYCYGGMKLAINVVEAPPPPSPSPQGNFASRLSWCGGCMNNIMPILVLAISMFITLVA